MLTASVNALCVLSCIPMRGREGERQVYKPMRQFTRLSSGIKIAKLACLREVSIFLRVRHLQWLSVTLSFRMGT